MIPVVSKLQRSAILVLLVLTAGAIFAFAAVNHLVKRFSANEQARGRRLYAQAQSDLNAGESDRAIEELRAALSCDRSNPQYQLSLGRALRDTGRLDEAQSYLESLWERSPEDGTINLALARVATKRGSIEDALRYYHNAMYGVWGVDADVNRRKARIELVQFLLQKGALEQARSELLSLAVFLPADPALILQTADMLSRAQDYPDALREYDRVLHLDHGNAAALAGAAQTAYRAGYYRSALRYSQTAVNANPQKPDLRNMLASSKLILEADPFARRISDAERNRRISGAFTAAGVRLEACAAQKGVDLSAVEPAASSLSALPSNSPLVALQSRWIATKPDLAHLRSAAETDLPDVIMDLVFEIEQRTAQDCGEPQGLDEALLRISRDRDTVDQ